VLRSAALLLVAACGRLGFDPSAARDANAAACPQLAPTAPGLEITAGGTQSIDEACIDGYFAFRATNATAGCVTLRVTTTGFTARVRVQLPDECLDAIDTPTVEIIFPIAANQVVLPVISSADARPCGDFTLELASQ
jgi:hypothetical protein